MEKRSLSEMGSDCAMCRACIPPVDLLGVNPAAVEEVTLTSTSSGDIYDLRHHRWLCTDWLDWSCIVNAQTI